jgi:hypothetical protein
MAFTLRSRSAYGHAYREALRARAVRRPARSSAAPRALRLQRPHRLGPRDHRRQHARHRTLRRARDRRRRRGLSRMEWQQQARVHCRRALGHPAVCARSDRRGLVARTARSVQGRAAGLRLDGGVLVRPRARRTRPRYRRSSESAVRATATSARGLDPRRPSLPHGVLGRRFVAGRGARRGRGGGSRVPRRHRPQQRSTSARVRTGRRWPAARGTWCRGHDVRRALERLGHRSLVGVPRAGGARRGSHAARGRSSGRGRVREPSEAPRPALGVRGYRRIRCGRGLERAVGAAQQHRARVLGGSASSRRTHRSGRRQRHALPQGRRIPIRVTHHISAGQRSGSRRETRRTSRRSSPRYATGTRSCRRRRADLSSTSRPIPRVRAGCTSRCATQRAARCR